MKKNVTTILFLIFIIAFSGCSKVSEKKPFSYLPTYEPMTFENFEKATEEEGLDHATFIAKDSNYKTFLADYENFLHENGWQTTDDKKPISINLEKDNHVVVLVVTSKSTDEEVKGIIYSK